MDIFFTIDENFKLYLLITITSILLNSNQDDEFRFHILDAGLSEDTKNKIEKLKESKNFSIDYVKMSDADFLEYPINPVLTSKIYYYRLKIPQLFPNVKRALFLDTDIFVQTSLSELYNIDMNGKTVAFAPNGNVENELQNDRLGLSGQHQYFNAGVMLIDCDKWRELNILEKTLNIAKENYEILKWADQDMLNIIFEKNYLQLSPKWNFWPGMNIKGYELTLDNYSKWLSHVETINRQQIETFINSPCIIHYAGGAKPDRKTCTDKIKEQYKKYYGKLVEMNIVKEENNHTDLYDEAFYKEQAENSYKSAKMFMPYLMKYCNPKSVIDVGCGVGTWLKAFKENGVQKLLGIDGNKIDDKILYMPREILQIEDLEKVSKNTGEKYDLLISLEVAEHLDANAADRFIEVLTSYADDIFFSAAIPYQGGINHINEQPPQYWVDKFKNLGYYCFDIVRDKLLNDEKLFYGCYAQNGFIFSKNKEKFEALGFKATQQPMFFYHPWHINVREDEIRALKLENEQLKNEVNSLKKKGILKYIFSKEKVGNKRTLRILGIKISYKKGVA